jgi:hypothetical protein
MLLGNGSVTTFPRHQIRKLQNEWFDAAFFFCVHQKQQEALNLLVTEERYWALFYMPLYTFLHNFLNLLAQIANKMGLHKEDFLKYC